MTSRAKRQIAFGVLTGAGVACLLSIAVLMRPIADDYCYAAGVKNGLWNAIVHRYLFEGGNLFETLVVLVQVGLPLVVMPLWAASGFSWLLTVAAVYGGIATTIKFLFPGQGRTRTAAVAISITGALWLPYWWMPALVPGLERMRPVFMRTAKDMLVWHSMQSQYVVVPALVLVVALSMQRSRYSNLSKALVFGLLGLCVGLSSLILGGGVMLTFAVACLTKPGRKFCLRIHNLCFFGALLLGIAVQISAPGTFGRLSQVEAGVVDVPITSKLGHALADGISQFPLWAIVCTANVGVILALATGFLSGRWNQRKKIALEGQRALRLGLWFCILGYAMLLSEKILESITYFALWHLTYARVALMVGSLMMGVWLSHKLPRVKRDNILMASVGSLVVLSIIWSATSVTAVSAERVATWAYRPHAEGDAAEATYNSWVLDCAVSAGLRQRN